MLSLLPVLALLGAALPAAGAPAKPLAPHGEKLGSLYAHMDQAYSLAKRWSPDARLLLVIGRGPSGKYPMSEEEWLVVFAAPMKKDFTLQINFKEGALSRNTEELKIEWTKDCGAIDVLFLDSAKLEELANGSSLEWDLYGQRHFTLYRPNGKGCDLPSLRHAFAPGDKLAGKTMWVLSGSNADVFLDAKTGKRLARFARR